VRLGLDWCYNFNDFNMSILLHSIFYTFGFLVSDWSKVKSDKFYESKLAPKSSRGCPISARRRFISNWLLTECRLLSGDRSEFRLGMAYSGYYIPVWDLKMAYPGYVKISKDFHVIPRNYAQNFIFVMLRLSISIFFQLWDYQEIFKKVFFLIFFWIYAEAWPKNYLVFAWWKKN